MILAQTSVRLLITDGTLTPENFSQKRDALIETIRLAVAARIEMIQLREKLLPARLAYQVAVDAVSIASGSATKILINERFDIAIAAGADGVHLTSSSMPVDLIRGNVPDEFIVGVSAHSMDDVVNAKGGGADYALLGPIFATPGKGEPLGVGALSCICHVVDPFPVMAVGGVDESNFQSVLDAGAAGFAAIRYFNEFVKIS